MNIVQFKNLDVENVKVDISNGAAGNGENISGIPHSYSCETKCTYHSVSTIKNADAEDFYVHIQVNL